MTYSEYLELEAVFGTPACCMAFDSSLLYLQYLIEKRMPQTFAERIELLRKAEEYFMSSLESRYRAPE